MPSHHPVAFLVDVDNTLLDNDHIAADLKRHLEHTVGPERQARYWAIFEELRASWATPTIWAPCSAIG